MRRENECILRAVQVPDAELPVAGTGDESRAIVVESDGPHSALVPREGRRQPPRVEVA